MISNKFLSGLVIVAVVVAILNVSITFIKISDFGGPLTGYSTKSGYVNVTVATQIVTNMTSDTINWGSGIIDIGETNATLYTNGANTASVLRGNWSTAPTGMVLANIGNINASITLQSAKTAITFIGGTNPSYQWNISNKDSASCTGGETMNVFRNVNQSTASTLCTQFGYLLNQNEIYIDILLSIPYDATNTGAQSDTITSIASTAVP